MKLTKISYKLWHSPKLGFWICMHYMKHYLVKLNTLVLHNRWWSINISNKIMLFLTAFIPNSWCKHTNMLYTFAQTQSIWHKQWRSLTHVYNSQTDKHPLHSFWDLCVLKITVSFKVLKQKTKMSLQFTEVSFCLRLACLKKKSNKACTVLNWAFLVCMYIYDD